ncbi:Fic family protein [Pseudoalteromonas tetraodonis]|uniref:Fic family protein n=1 Tax=Pseudoalteromonas tetraodonis TaxID=43659 RepID=UPI003466387D
MLEIDLLSRVQVKYIYPKRKATKPTRATNLLGLKDRKHFRERYLKPAIDAGIIEMTIPEKPNSKMQQYKLTQTS